MSCKECEEKSKVHPDFRKYKRLDMVSNYLLSKSFYPDCDPAQPLALSTGFVLSVFELADKIIDLNEQYEKEKK